MPGLARGLPADRPPRLLLLLRGVHPHHRLDVQPARQVAEGDARDPLAAARSPRSTTCSRRTSGARTTTASATRTRASSTTSSTRRRRWCASTCRRTPTRCCRSPTTACAAANYVNVIVAGKQPALQWLAMDDAIKHCTRGHRHLGVGEQRRGRDPDVVMACCGDVPTLETLAAVELLREHLPELKVRVVNVVDLMTLQPETEHPHGLSRPRVRRAVHEGPADHLRVPRLPVADPPPDLPADQPRRTCTCAATRRRARRPRRSTWSCATTSTASTSSGT